MLLLVVLCFQRILLGCFMQGLPSYVKLIVVILTLTGMTFVLDTYEGMLRLMFHNAGEERSRSIDESRCKQYSCCHISDSGGCPIDAMERDETTLVHPGGKTRCLTSYDGSFVFQVVPGDTDKVFFYMQGGGGCQTELSEDLLRCRQQCDAEIQLDKEWHALGKSEKFLNYTIIAVLYCSGDFHTGNRKRDYYDAYGEHVEQRGLLNARAVLDWTTQQQQNGLLADPLSELVLSGASAGSMGIQIWSDEILSSLKWERAAVIPDSWLYVFPEGTFQDSIVDVWAFCDIELLPSDLREKCYDKKLEIQNVLLRFASNHPSVPFAFISSKADATQFSGYQTQVRGEVTAEDMYNDMNKLLAIYAEQMPNSLVYLVDGDNHVFIPHDEYYTADARGPTDGGHSTNGTMLQEWVEQFPLQPGATAHSICEGAIRKDPFRRLLGPPQNGTHLRFLRGEWDGTSGGSSGVITNSSVRGSAVPPQAVESLDSRSRAQHHARLFSDDKQAYCLQAVVDQTFTQPLEAETTKQVPQSGIH